MDTKSIALTVIFASLYASLVIVLAPIAYGPIQLRVADCLLPLTMIFGWPVVFGVTLGCLVGNVYLQLGLYDIVLGSLANFIAASLIFILRKRAILACITGSITIGLIVGGYLWMYFPPPDIFGLITFEWVAMIISITLSSLISLTVIGYALFKILSKSIFFED
ncbi:MAG: QueT transporter family protein [Candidatus Methylarchaceae archaeon HK01M]|nr:QueT transporter family protein [Candidatus Methylarchaceae archaeon HK01M]